MALESTWLGVQGTAAPAGAVSPWSARDVARLGLLLSLATALHIFEAQLPALPIPGAKMGLANLVSLFALYAWGWREALLLALLRQLLGSLITGTLLSPAFFFGLAGGLAAVAVMALVLRLLPWVGPVSISLLGAASHNVGQLVVAWWLLGQVQVFYYLPYLLWFAVPAGVLVGITVSRLLPCARLWAPAESPRALRVQRAAAWSTAVVLGCAGVLVGAVMFTGSGGVGVENAEAVVRVQGELHARLPLDGPGEHEVVVDGGRVLIETDEGRVRVARSTCRYQICVNTGWIHSPRQSIVNLPYQIVITIEGAPAGDEDYDGLTY